MRELPKNYLLGKKKFLVRLGKQLLKYSLQSIPIYFISIFKISVVVSRKIEHIQRSFIWARKKKKLKFALVAWDKYYKTMEVGELDFKKLIRMNLDSIGKLG